MGWKHYGEEERAERCQCGMGLIPEGASQINWYWQKHRRDVCVVELPNRICWCGLRRSEHEDGHRPEAVFAEELGIAIGRLREHRGDCKECGQAAFQKRGSPCARNKVLQEEYDTLTNPVLEVK